MTGLRVLVYQHSAVGRDILPRILQGLGAVVLAAGRSETFVPIDTVLKKVEAVTPERIQSVANDLLVEKNFSSVYVRPA